MENFTVADILEATQGRLMKGNPNTIVSGISTDSRTLAAGRLFIALRGENFDGHEFVAQAVRRGAAGAVVSRNIEGFAAETLIMVEDTLKALGDMAKFYRRKFIIPVVGITGSNGKTSTKNMIASVLAQKYCILSTEGNFNNAIGLPMTLFRLSSAHEVAVLEMGTGAPGEMKRLVEIADPNVAVVTNIGPTHLEFFGSVDEVADEKAVLARSVNLAVLNADDHRVARMRSLVNGTAILFGMAEEADVLATEIRQDQSGRSNFSLVADGTKVRICLSALGKYNVYNALAAASVGLLFRMKMDEIKNGLESYKGAPKRMQELTVDGITIIDDTYNSNPVSLRAALDLLSKTECDGKKVAVVGDMLELGERSEILHRQIGRYIASCPIHTLVTVGNRAAAIAEAAIDDGIPEDRIFACETNLEAAKCLHSILSEGDIALIKGSRGMRMEEIIETLETNTRNESYTVSV